MIIPNKYVVQARYIPAIISSMPLIILTSLVKDEVWLPLFRNAWWFLALEGLSLNMIFIIFIMSVQRGLAKYLFENKIFKDGKGFPATLMLLHSDVYLSHDFKTKIRQKIKEDFDIDLLGQSEENNNFEEAHKLIRDTVSLIRNTVGDGNKTLQYSIHYGFIRNLIGGATFSSVIAVVDLIIFLYDKNIYGIIISGLIAIFMIIILLFNKTILRHFAYTYAKCLFTEYITKK